MVNRRGSAILMLIIILNVPLFFIVPWERILFDREKVIEDNSEDLVTVDMSAPCRDQKERLFEQGKKQTARSEKPAADKQDPLDKRTWNDFSVHPSLLDGVPRVDTPRSRFVRSPSDSLQCLYQVDT